MPITLAKIASNTAPIMFRFDEEDVNLIYYPSRITERVLAQFILFEGMDETNFTIRFKEFNETLASLLKWWDVYEDEEQTMMFPLEAKRLAELPLVFRLRVFREIMADIRPEAFAPQT